MSRKLNVPDPRLSAALIELQAESGHTWSHIAEAIGVSRGAVMMLRAGRNSPTWATVLRLAEFFCVSVGYFAGERPSKPKKKIRAKAK